VSAKVRQLDLAKSRVAECQQRVHDLIDLKRCSEGVTTAFQVQSRIVEVFGLQIRNNAF
jgi:hypothetical protein